MRETTRTTSKGTLVTRKFYKVQGFHCDACGEDKTSKNIAELTAPSGEKKTLCNGCCGQLLAEKP